MKNFSLLIVFISSFASAQSHTDFIGTGNVNDITATSSDPSSSPMKTMNGAGFELETQQASRFLAHATLGATMQEIEELTTLGLGQWIGTYG